MRKPIENRLAGFTVRTTASLPVAVLMQSPMALAGEGPSIVTGPTIVGTAAEGRTMEARATDTGTPTPTATWRWLRCTGKGSSTCTAIPEAAQSTSTAADAEHRIRARLAVRSSTGEDDAQSSATEVVHSPPLPTPTATPTATPPLLDPSPVVRIRGHVTRTGAYLTLLTIVSIRQSRPPAPVDRCLYPGSLRARRCGT